MNYIWDVWALGHTVKRAALDSFSFFRKLLTQKLASVYFFKCAFLTLRHCFINPHHLILEIPKDQHETELVPFVHELLL